MRMKGNKKTILTLGIVFLLSACNSTIISFEPYQYGEKDTDSHELVEGDGYVKYPAYSSYESIDKDDDVFSFNSYKDVFRHQNYLHMMNTTGLNKMIVIPIDFADYECSKLSYGCKLSRNLIQNAFFGTKETTQYESVASYFDKSSYGKLKIDGIVTDWFHLDLKDSSGEVIDYEYLSRSTTKKTIVADIYKEALKWFQNKYGNIANYYIEGDENNGVPIYFIYSAPNVDSSLANDNVLWAYTFNTSGLFAWSSFHMLNINYKNKVDPHTYIHEVGHMLGLADYYATSTKPYSPTGHMDMMDYSLGDETGYSKMVLDWTRPYYVTDTTEIKIKPFYESGDLILIKNLWNKTPMDEYLLIEMYSPKGLNEVDSKSKNPASKLYSKTGVKIYHVDSRLAYFSKTRMSPISYVEEKQYSPSTNRIGIAHTNTIVPNSEILKYPLYQLLDKDEKISYLNGGYATDDSLFYQNDSFGIETYKNYKFHSGQDLGYTIFVKTLSDSEATIRIEKL